MLEISLVFVMIFCSPVVSDQKLIKIGAHKDWAAYTFKISGNKVCYMASAPIKETGKYKRRGDVYSLVTNRPASKITGEVNFIAGYEFKKGSEVSVRIGKKLFKLMTAGDGAWSEDAKADVNLVKAMVRGNRMVVSGVSSRGTKTKDIYSLAGFTATKKLIDKACRK